MLNKLWLAAFFGLVAVTSLSASEPPFAPTRFTARIGGFLGSTYEVELRGETLFYTGFDAGHQHPRRIEIVPSAAQWREFRQTLDAMEVWRWRGDYPNPGVDDGTQWLLEIVYPNRVVKTKGDNNYPDRFGAPNGKPEFSPVFNRYLAAMQKLTGGKTFK